MVGTFIAVFMSVTGIVYLNYPDRPAYPRSFEGGLERELGGPGATRVSGHQSVDIRRLTINRLVWRVMRILEPRCSSVYKKNGMNGSSAVFNEYLVSVTEKTQPEVTDQLNEPT
jgi:hypothetical protein